MSPDSNNPEIAEVVWDAWLKKNERLDRLRYERRLKIIVLIAVFVVVSTLLWLFAR